ncbi:PLP-dependent aminotransferase family protein [Arthrobacter sp. NPDC058192]|uniref:aminotransferase-like domain-containing protein n=1 Tax=Arthrobacter sp. NPDC058192 TaxID=3346372 RepID=UPI0036F12B34
MAPSPMTTSSPPIELSDRVASGRSSEVRKVFQAAMRRPGIISFANGSPFLGELPFDRLADEAHRILTELGSTALQYGTSNGIPELRRHIVDLMALEGIAADPEQVIITAGSQQAIGFVAHATVNPGDVVFAEGPSYAGAMAVFSSYEAEIVHVPSDEDGLIPADLERLIGGARAAGKRPRALYTVPNFQNPGGMNLSAERRGLLGRICQDQGLLLFEDNPYGLLGFDGGTMRAIQPDAPEITFYFGSFSKMFAPGLRLGWVLAPETMHQHLTDIAQTAALNPSVFNQLMMAAYLDNPSWRDTLATYRGLYRTKLEALVGALTEHMPAGTTWNRPTGGFYLWVTVPPGIDTHELVHEAIERGVAYVPGTAFYANGAGRSELRLSFCLPSVEEIRHGTAILGGLFTEALA